MEINLTPEQKILLSVKEAIEEAIYNEELNDTTKEEFYCAIGMIRALVELKNEEQEAENGRE